MKIKPEDLQEITALVKPLDTPEIRAKYKAGDYPRAELVHNKDMRYRWDLLWMADPVKRRAWFDRVYKYAHDDHIDTALRSIVPTLEAT